ncbi:MAG: ECF transporter S component [Clostridia bacterium]|nr:ECF transporter S component [Clostridia bacterium]
MTPNRGKGFLKSFALYDLILIAMLTALSIAIKTIAGTLVRMITGPLGIPGGALAGGFYMMWLPLAVALTNRRGTALLVAALQTLIMITTGAPGSHGIWTILTYMLPALPVELIFFFRKKGYPILHFLAASALANITGTYLSNLLFFRMSFYPLMFTLLAAAFSGALGGVIGYFAYTKAQKAGIIKSKPMCGNADVQNMEQSEQSEVITDGANEQENG